MRDTAARAQAAALLRSPERRIISAYFFGRHRPMFPAGNAFWPWDATTAIFDLGGAEQHAAFARWAATTPPAGGFVAAYASAPGIASCQTKMVLGRRCGDDVHLTAADLAEAIRRLEEDFLFVGVQEHFRESVLLAHAMLAPDLSADVAKLAETASATHKYSRPQSVHRRLSPSTARGRGASRPGRYERALRNLTAAGYHDDFDGPLYDAALRIFRRNAAKFGVDLAQGRDQDFRRAAQPEFGIT